MCRHLREYNIIKVMTHMQGNLLRFDNSMREVLGDILLRLTFLPTTLRHLHTFLLIVANSRQSALTALIAESNGHMTETNSVHQISAFQVILPSTILLKIWTCVNLMKIITKQNFLNTPSETPHLTDSKTVLFLIFRLILTELCIYISFD